MGATKCSPVADKRPEGACLVLVLGDELGEGFHCLLGVIALGPDRDLVALLGAERHDLERALRVRLAFALDHDDVGRILLRGLDKLRRRTGVEPLLWSDRRLPLSHEPLLSHSRPSLYRDHEPQTEISLPERTCAVPAPGGSRERCDLSETPTPPSRQPRASGASPRRRTTRGRWGNKLGTRRWSCGGALSPAPARCSRPAP